MKCGFDFRNQRKIHTEGGFGPAQADEPIDPRDAEARRLLGNAAAKPRTGGWDNFYGSKIYAYVFALIALPIFIFFLFYAVYIGFLQDTGL